MNEEQLNLIMQILETMDESSARLEEAYKEGDKNKFESSKIEIANLQKRLAKELEKCL